MSTPISHYVRDVLDQFARSCSQQPCTAASLVLQPIPVGETPPEDLIVGHDAQHTSLLGLINTLLDRVGEPRVLAMVDCGVIVEYNTDQEPK